MGSIPGESPKVDDGGKNGSGTSLGQSTVPGCKSNEGTMLLKKGTFFTGIKKARPASGSPPPLGPLPKGYPSKQSRHSALRIGGLP